MYKKKTGLTILSILFALIIVSQTIDAYAKKPGVVPIFLDPKTIPKWVNQLVVPPVYAPDTTG
ncbi:hypothetical protein E4H04_06510, partial [Candidatus Bathyarchaeota archaeon]